MKKEFAASAAAIVSAAMILSTGTAAFAATITAGEAASAAGGTSGSSVIMPGEGYALPDYRVVTSTYETATVTVYDFGSTKLHAFFTNDALGDVAYIVESYDYLIGIELPAFTADLDVWQSYAASLEKPMNDIFLCSHPTGASYVEGMNVLGTQGAADSILGGTTRATTQGLYETFGEDFHGGDDIAAVNSIVSGTVTVAGLEFEVIENGETYDIAIPSMNFIYTHMLGKYTHSILVSTAHMDAMTAVLESYEDAGYELVLTSHGGPEGQDAVAEKIAYLAQTKAIAEVCTDAAAFTAAMTEAFPEYDGLNYLEMTAGCLFPEA